MARSFVPRQRRPPQGLVDFVVQSVELQKYGADPALCQMGGIAVFPRKPDAIGIELEEGKALLFSQRDDFVQIVPHGGLAAGELDVEGAAVLHEKVVLLPDFLHG